MGVFQNNLMGAAAAAASAGGAGFYTHQIANSCRFNRPNASKLSRALGTATANTKWTFSSWVKLSSFSTGTSDGRNIFGGTGSTYGLKLGFEGATANAQQLLFLDYPSNSGGPNAGGVQTLVYLKKVFRDPNAWYHIVVAQDTTQSTASDRIKFYVNGELQTEFENYTSGGSPTPFYPSQNSATINDSAHSFLLGVGDADSVAASFDGYQAETYFIDGTAYAASDFGESKNGVWIPKDASGLTFGNNGFYLKYESSSDLGNDSSGNNNDYTVSNISAHDQMLDTPTFNSDSNGGNYCTLNPLFPDPTLARITNGNLQWGGSEGGGSVNDMGCMSTFAIPPSDTNIYYFEARMKVGPSGGVNQAIGVNVPTVDLTSDRGGRPTAWCISNNADQRIYNGANSYTTTGVSGSAGDIVGVEIDRANTTIKFYVNGTLRGTQTNLNTTTDLYPWVGTGGSTSSGLGWDMNFGQNGTFNGLATAQGETDATGYGNFYYDEAGSGKALCTGNLPVAAEVDPAQTDDDYPQKVSNSVLYTGNGSSQSVTGVGFQPNFTWIKNRNDTQGHKLFDSTRGVTKMLNSSSNDAEATESGLSAFNSDGFSLGGSTVAGYNTSSNTYVAWNWKESADYGLDVVTYSGTLTGSGVVNISHSLGAIPECIWHMRRTGAGGAIRHKDLTDANYIISNNDTMSGSSGTGWGKSAQGSKSGNGNMTALGTSSTFTTNYTGLLNENGNTYVTYVWRGIEGFSKFGSYVANGSSTDNAFVYLGFRPAIIITKGTRYGDGYNIHDNATSPFNLADTVLQPNTSSAELSNYNIDMLSNGFKVRDGDGDLGSNGVKYIYMAWAENPFKYATAR
jgi:hypothetical protein